MSHFKQFNFHPFINEALAEKGFQQPTEVQERLIPLILKGKISSDNHKLVQEKRIRFFCLYFKKSMPIKKKSKW